MNDNVSIIRTEVPHDRLAQKPRIDLGRTSGKNPPTKRLVRFVREFAKSVTKTSSKVQKPKTYDETINNSIYKNKWRETFNKEL